MQVFAIAANALLEARVEGASFLAAPKNEFLAADVAANDHLHSVRLHPYLRQFNTTLSCQLLAVWTKTLQFNLLFPVHKPERRSGIGAIHAVQSPYPETNHEWSNEP